MRKTGIITAGFILSFNALAGTMGSEIPMEKHRLSVIGSIGYTNYNDAYKGGPSADELAQSAIGDGQTPVGRFAIGWYVGNVKSADIGLELGLQSGNTMRIDVAQTTLNIMGGLPIQTTVKPMLDLLVTATWQPLQRAPVFAIIKGGIAYRRMQVNDRVTVNDLSEVAFEAQAGLGVHVIDAVNLSLTYQGIFDGNLEYTVNDSLLIAHQHHIPNQNGVLLNISYTI